MCRSGGKEMRKLSIANLIRRWRKKDDGLVAVEFAMLSIPFLLLIMGTLEVSLYFAAGLVLEGSSNSAARLIRTGQIDASPDPETAFADMLCDQADAILDCTKLQYEVIAMDDGTFSSAAATSPVFDPEGNLIGAGFSPGGSEDVVLVRTAYKYEFLMPMVGTLLSGDSGQNWLTLGSTVVIKNEPFTFGSD
ncbi:MAG: pilus assembly protein [Alphaproteobacteria bacterium]|nr:pilus assembly protein [Alphaproteobacteria bacterium]